MGAEVIVLFLVAIMAVLGLLIMMGRLNLKRFLGYPNTVDISASLLFLWMFEGTFSGMVVAGFASLVLSLILWILRASVGAERLRIRRIGWVRFKLYWHHIPASACQPHWIAKMLMRAKS